MTTHPPTTHTSKSLISRRSFLAATVAATSLHPTNLFGESSQSTRPLLHPIHDAVVCPWTPQHPRHDHQLIFPLDSKRLLLVWSEYYSRGEIRDAKKGHAGIGDSVPARSHRWFPPTKGVRGATARCFRKTCGATT